MRKISLKVFASLMVIVFFIQPILQIGFGLGKTEALQPGDTVSGYTYNEIYEKLSPGTYVKIESVENVYKVRYANTVTLKDVWSCYCDHYHEGLSIGTNKSGVTAKVISISKDYKGKGRHTKPDLDVHSREDYYMLTLGIECYATSDFVKGVPSASSFKTIKASHGIGPYGHYANFELELVPVSWELVRSKYTGRVMSVSNSDSSRKIEYTESVKKVIEQTDGGNPYYATNNEGNGGGDSGGGYDNNFCEDVVIDEPVVKDKYISVSNATKRKFIIMLYNRMLGRKGRTPATEAEINSHMGGTIQQIAHNFVFSEEAATGWLSNEAFIDKLYRVFLNRGPDEEGMRRYLDMLSAPERHNVLKDIVESTEFEEVIRNVDSHVEIDEAHQRMHIIRLYRTYFGREPNENEMNALLKNYVQGNAKEVIFSIESNKHCGVDQMDNRTFVEYLYKGILGRQGDEEGIVGHTNMLNNGFRRDDLVKAFVESDEFRGNCEIPLTEVSFDSEEMCDIVYKRLVGSSFSVYRINESKFCMYERELASVRTLDLSGKDLKNLNGISVFPNLEKLLVQGNDFEDISELTKLHNLKYLNVNGCFLGSKTSIFNNLTSLEELHMDNNNLDFWQLERAISNLSNLKVLSVNSNRLSDVDAAFQLPNIKEIYADYNKIGYVNLHGKTLDAISLLGNTTSNSSYGSDKELPDLFKKAQIQGNALYADGGLEFENCRIENNAVKMTDRSAKITIKGGPADGSTYTMKNSENVIIINDDVLANRLQSKLGDMVKQRMDVNGKHYLYVDQNYTDTVEIIDLSTKENDTGEITDITGLESLRGLKSINLNGNKVQNINKLSTLNFLESLSLRYNGLTNYEALSSLGMLEQLDISNNLLTTTSGVESLTRLNTLLISNNNIGDNLDGIKGLKGLVTLDISNNNVHSLDALTYCNIENIFASYNSISNPKQIASKESTRKLVLKNNQITVDFNGTEGQVPDMIDYVISAAGLNTIQAVNCTLEDNTVTIKDGSKVAQLKVKSGTASDTVVTIRNVEADKPYDVTVTYNKNDDGSVTAKIKSDVPIRHIASWERNTEKTEYSKTYEYNVNENIEVTNEKGEKVVKNIQINNADTNKISGLRLSYDNYDQTNGTVTMTITADEAMYLPPSWIGDGVLQYNISEDQKTITKVFNVNGMRSVAICSQTTRNRINFYTEQHNSGMMSDAEYNEKMSIWNAKYVQVGTEVSNIDTTAPECNVTYSTQEKTKSSVRATIWADEDIELTDKTNLMYEPASKVNNEGKTVYGISLYFAENTTRDVEVQDAVGNKSTVHIAINNIDKYVDGLDVNTLVGLATNQSDTVVVKANEAITISNEDGNILKVSDFRINGFALPYNVSLVGNTRSANSVTITRNEPGRGVIEADDGANNTDTALFNTNNIDNEAPNPGRYDTVNDDGSVTVELRFEEEIQDTPELSSWTFNDDKTSITKTFKFNGNEKITLKDLAGNETTYDVVVNSIDTINHVISYERIYSSDRWVVTIIADEDIQLVDGWTYLENHKKIAKVFVTGEKESVIINGIEKGSSIVSINVEDPSTKEDPTAEELIPESTESNKILPKTGAGFGVAIFAAIAGFLTLRNRRRLQTGYKKSNSKRRRRR